MLVSPNHVASSKERKIVIPGFAGFRIQFKRPNAAVATSGHIYANDIMQFRIEQLGGSDQARPPFRRITVSSKGMKDPYNVIPVCIQMSMSGVSKVYFREGNTTLEGKRLVVFVNIYHIRISQSRKGAKKTHFLL
jgi:hypothetical protein